MFSEQRQSPRKILKVKAGFVPEDGAAAVAGRSLDVGSNGMCITLAGPLKMGQAGQLSFELFLDGKASTIDTRSKVVYCIFSNGEFKVGFQFLNLALSAMAQLARYLR
ncbi:MAG: PilZ domain-containing protein [Telluria sp.]